MGARSRSRENALQALYFMDIRQNISKEMLELYCQSFSPSKKAQSFFFQLVDGVMDARSQIDSIIERFSSHWRIERMACVDRNVLRIAIYEMMFCGDIPPKVTINEAINIGKKFGTDESGAFINGILDSIRIAAENGEIQIEGLNSEISDGNKAG